MSMEVNQKPSFDPWCGNKAQFPNQYVRTLNGQSGDIVLTVDDLTSGLEEWVKSNYSIEYIEEDECLKVIAYEIYES